MGSRYSLYRMLRPQWFFCPWAGSRETPDEWMNLSLNYRHWKLLVGMRWKASRVVNYVFCFANTAQILLLWKYSGVGPLWFWIPGACWMWGPVAGIVATRILRFLYLISEVQSSILRNSWLAFWREKIFSGWQKEKFLKIMKFGFVTSSCTH